MGVDKIYPGVYFFAKGGNANNDPWRGYIFCFVIAFALCMIAKQVQKPFVVVFITILESYRFFYS